MIVSNEIGGRKDHRRPAYLGETQHDRLSNFSLLLGLGLV
jgi:hypothetical protein